MHPATNCRPLPCSTPWRNINSMQPSVAHEEMRRRRVPRNASSVIVTSSDNGTRRTSALSSGTSSTAERTWASTSVCSLSPTGPRWMYGSISSWRTSRCLRSTSPTKERYSTATDNGSQPCLASSASLQKKW